MSKYLDISVQVVENMEEDKVTILVHPNQENIIIKLLHIIKYQISKYEEK